MKIGIYGGTFNPPHTGHRKAAQEAIRALGLDKLLVIPTAEPPHKDLPEATASGEQRLALARLSFAGLKGVEVSDLELVRGGKSYTIDTVRELRARYPKGDFWLVMGGDMFLSVERWYEAESLLKELGLAVSAREGEREDILACAERLRREKGARVEFIDTPPIVISSTALREQLRNASGREYMTPEAYAWLIKNRLYGAKAELSWLREQAKSMLDPKRVPHALGVEQEAVRLAERWGADVYSAAAAGILHDITKRCSDKEQLQLCEKYGTLTDTLEKEIPKLLHAKTGAAVAWYEFGVSEAVREAICWHTTGKEDMSLLEKIIYLADYIEPNRNFDGLEELRRLAYEDLDEALRLGLRMSLDEMEQRGIVPHPNSVKALAYIEKRLQEKRGRNPITGVGAI